ELLQRGGYVVNRGRYVPVKIDRKGPLQLAEAENAVQIARLAGADKYAADTMNKAQVDLRNAEAFLATGDRKRSETNDREAAQMAEDARIIWWRKIQAEQLANERAAAAQREADAKAQADMEAKRRAEAESARASAESERIAAERAKRQAEQAAVAAAQE